MRTRPPGARMVRLLARSAALLYPTRFRQRHGRDFPDVADHLYAREAARHDALGATMAASRVIVADTLETTPAMWMDVITDGDPTAPVGRSLVRRAGGWLRDSGHDLKLAGRAAVRHPAFSLLVIATLGLGIGASAAAFDALDRAILRPLPFAKNRELVLLMMQEQTQKFTTSVPIAALNDWRAHATTLTHVEVFRRTGATRTTAAGADVLDAIGVSGGLPAMLGVRPVVGRTITQADAAASAPKVVMLGERFWKREYGGDSSAIGRTMMLSNTPYEIIGVWPAGARLDFQDPPDLIRVLPAGAEYAQGSWVQVLGRMRPGATVAQVQQELRALTPPGAPPRAYVATVTPPADILLGDQFVTGVWVVFVGALLLLGAAVANAGHLLLERATARAHELGVRLALGGSHTRLLRLFLAEGIVYAGGGLLLGAAVAFGLERGIAVYEPRLFLDAAGAGLGGRAFIFAAAVAVTTALVCTAAPLLRRGRADINHAIGRAHTRTTARRSRAVSILVATQAALAVLLVFGAALMIASLRTLLTVDPGIDAARLAEFSVSLPAARYPTPDSRRAYRARALEALTAMPGVRGVVTSGMPILNASLMNGAPYLVGEQEPQLPPDATTAVMDVPANYLQVMGLRLVAGRMFTADDTDAVLVSELFARARGNVLGAQLTFPRARPGDTTYRIVGIVKDVRYMGLANDAILQPAVYKPQPDSSAEAYTRFIARTDGDPSEVIAGARRRFAEIDRGVPLLGPQTGPEVLQHQTAQHRFVAMLVAGLAGLGFLLAASGVYGAVSLGVVQRTREVGLRMALGAAPARLVTAFVRNGLRPVLIGAVTGIAIAWLAAPSVKALLFRIGPQDPMSTAIGLSAVLATSAVAAWLPARRISRVDPATTLREA